MFLCPQHKLVFDTFITTTYTHTVQSADSKSQSMSKFLTELPQKCPPPEKEKQKQVLQGVKTHQYWNSPTTPHEQRLTNNTARTPPSGSIQTTNRHSTRNRRSRTATTRTPVAKLCQVHVSSTSVQLFLPSCRYLHQLKDTSSRSIQTGTHQLTANSNTPPALWRQLPKTATPPSPSLLPTFRQQQIHLRKVRRRQNSRGKLLNNGEFLSSGPKSKLTVTHVHHWRVLTRLCLDTFGSTQCPNVINMEMSYYFVAVLSLLLIKWFEKRAVGGELTNH